MTRSVSLTTLSRFDSGRLIVLNRIARSVVEEVRGKHSDYVFTYRGRPLTKSNNTAWKRARLLAGLEAVKSDPKCASIENSVTCVGDDMHAEVRCQRSGSSGPLMAAYTLAEYELSRIETGRKPAEHVAEEGPRSQAAASDSLTCTGPRYAPCRARVHDLKHTFGRRLRAAGVPVETRKVLLGHRNGDITTHYSAPELEGLQDAANRVCGKSPALVVLKTKAATASAVTA